MIRKQLKIVSLEIKKLSDRTKGLNIKLNISAKAKQWIAEKGFKPEYGARPMRRVISDYIETPLSEGILDEEYKKGDTILVDLCGKELKLKKTNDK